MLALLLGLVASAEEPPPTPAKSQLDWRLYRPVTLDNGLRVLLVSDGNIGYGAAAVSVHRGSASDPDERLGLAHFYEHMLFMGTETHPDPDAFTRFVEEHGGNRDASTHLERTTFVFEIPRDHFAEGLNRFADFFSEPLLAPEAIERERQAVHSEFSLRQEDEGRRVAAVIRHSRPLGHPAARFGVGTQDTLGDRPSRNLREDLLAFRKANYTADQMTVALIDRQPLDALEALAREALADLPPGPGEPQTERPVPYLPEDVGAEVRIALPNRKVMRLDFPMPPLEPVWDHHPLTLLGDLFGDEGEGSILAELRERGWARELAAGSDDHHDHSLFRIEILLTEQGLAHRDEVAALVFAYAALLRTTDLSVAYHELASVNGLRVDLLPETPPMRGMVALAEAMHHRPIQHVLDAPGHHAPFDPEIHEPFLSGITPTNLRMLVIHDDVETNAFAPLYRTRFAVEPFSEARLTALRTPPSGAQLAPPPANPYVPRSTGLHPVHLDRARARRSGVSGLDLWMQHDTRFRTPEQIVSLRLTSPELLQPTPDAWAANLVFADLLDHHLKLLTYPAHRAGLFTRLSTDPHGLHLGLSGFEHAQLAYLADLVAAIPELEVEPGLARTMLDARLQAYQRFLRGRPVDIAELLARTLLYPEAPLPDEQRRALEELEPEDVEAFVERALRGYAGQLYVYGDVERSERKDWARAVAPLIRPGTLATPQLRRVPDAGFRVEIDSEQADSAVVVHIQAADRSPTSEARMRVLNALIRTDFFTQLRTVEQLGYVVGSWTDDVRGVPALFLAVQSNVAGPDAIEERIERFLLDLPERLAALSEDEMRSVRWAVLEGLDQAAGSAGRFAADVEARILAGDPNVRRPRAVLVAVRDLTTADVLDAAVDLTSRRFTLRVRGTNAPGEPEVRIDCQGLSCTEVDRLPLVE